MGNDFGRFLSEKRKEVGLTQKELADKLFISESAVSKWERNKANPDISMISELAEILKVSEHELISASVDVKERKLKTDAKKWRNLSSTWNLFFIILYSIALLTCFICNLAVNKTLSWFWIVFSSVLLSMSFTNFPKYIKKYRLLAITLIQLFCLILFFAICNIYLKTDWFLLATLPCVAGFIIIFLPIYISKYNVSKLLKNHNALFSIIADYLFLALTLFVVCIKTNGNWFFDFAVPLLSLVFALVIVFVFICRYTKFDKLIKSSILTFIFLPFMIVSYSITNRLCLNKFGIIVDEIAFPNFANWGTDILIRSNVLSIIALTIIFVAILLLVIYFIKKRKSISK